MAESRAVDAAPQFARPESGSTRLVSLDAYRGFVMVALLFDGYFPALARRFPGHPVLRELGRQFDHVDWQGGVFWDLIQPSFMFMVGVAMTYSFYSRRSRGQESAQISRHVIIRSVVFIILGLLLASIHSDVTQWKFGELLCQIGLAYPFASLLLGRERKTQWAAAAAVLFITWLAFLLYPVPGPGYDFARYQIPSTPEPFTGLFAHWNKYTNLAVNFDRWFLNLLPRPDLFLGNEKYVPTLNFIPSIVTLLLGIITGEQLRGDDDPRAKFRWLLRAGTAGLGVGVLFGVTICPVVKSLWTPSWVLASSGVVCWCLAAAYWLADLRGWVGPLFPFIIVGRNSLVMYLMFRACSEPIHQMLQIHFNTFGLAGHVWSFEVVAGALIMWLICLWLYRKRIFISI